ncbi:uncharacterized protein LOC113227661 [Hyposmocoma kahamanoa]|uniref:uncharacterized protein LOC113227661 n=1 Tax=Hyposmocoma kahamanoa TaxID=1477025 RepID=UPI000E6D60F2|nr:uncharacterized protein LOC113227661 [Hyposmocoma kahamanoa]XP_026316410.1 uncharacterized protein LOC113227661 [Hyposmocoma kahamanoa]
MLIVSFLVIFLTIHTANSYVLLTANLEDVQAIAKQLVNSPLADQVNKIWRRAANQFNLNTVKPKPTQRTKEDDDIKVKVDGGVLPNQQARAEDVESGRNVEFHESYLSAHEDLQQPQSLDAQLQSLSTRRKAVQHNSEAEKEKGQEDEDLVALGRNASVYLKSIRRIFQDM